MEPQASSSGLARVKVERDERDHLGLLGEMNVSWGSSPWAPAGEMS